MASAATGGPSPPSHANKVLWSNGVASEDLVVQVPLLHPTLQYTLPGSLASSKLSIFCRMFWNAKQTIPKPWLMFFQGASLARARHSADTQTAQGVRQFPRTGGPGCACPRGQTPWMKLMLEHFNIILMDQRGTGRSSPLHISTMASWAKAWGADVVASVLACFRADSIVLDAEAVRCKLLGPASSWHIMGQSFGGFCVVRYLSWAAAQTDLPAPPVAGAYITGGLPALPASATAAQEVYQHTYTNIRQRTKAYFTAYKADAARIHALQAAVQARPDGGEAGATPLSDSRYIALPDGSRFTMRLLASCGLALGLTKGPEMLHALLEKAFVAATPPQSLLGTMAPQAPAEPVCSGDASLEQVSLRSNLAFAQAIRDFNGFGRSPLYWLLHEAIYAQGPSTPWAAQAVVQQAEEAASALGEVPWGWYGEMAFPWLAEDCPDMAPLGPIAAALAARKEWPALYDSAALARNTVPTVAMVYEQDAFVPLQLSLATAAAIGNCHVLRQPTLQHDGLTTSPAAVIPALVTEMQRVVAAAKDPPVPAAASDTREAAAPPTPP